MPAVNRSCFLAATEYNVVNSETMRVRGAIGESERERLLVFAMLPQDVPLHVVCDHSQADVLLIVTVYIPDDRMWVGYRTRRERKQK